MLNTTLQVPCVGFSVAGLDRAKVGFFSFVCLFVCLFVFFVYCCHSDIDFTSNCILTHFNSDQSLVKIL